MAARGLIGAERLAQIAARAAGVLNRIKFAASGIVKTGRRLNSRSIANDFYKSAGWADDRIADHVRGIDFTKPVETVTIPKETEVVQWQRPGKPTGNYFAPPGTQASELGIYPGGRDPITYVTNRDVTVLRSTAKDVVDTWSVSGQPYQTQGGGTQYFVPDPSDFTPK